jgi:hypothetical protein
MEEKETQDELADAKRYLNYVLLEISNMKRVGRNESGLK